MQETSKIAEKPAAKVADTATPVTKVAEQPLAAAPQLASVDVEKLSQNIARMVEEGGKARAA